ncbi:MAG TPA: cupin domain-containing protein [Xanthobacteraceae bacterium]|jgi:cupin 2 domain-containing protein
MTGGVASQTGNLFAPLPEPGAYEQCTPVFSSAHVRVERIVSHGQASPPGFWYDQDRAEWVVLLAGSAGLLMEGEAAARVLRRGDHVIIPPHVRHRVEWTDPAEATIWLAVHCA